MFEVNGIIEQSERAVRIYLFTHFNPETVNIIMANVKRFKVIEIKSLKTMKNIKIKLL